VGRRGLPSSAGPGIGARSGEMGELAWPWLIARRSRILMCIALGAFAAGGVASLVGEGDLGNAIWGVATALVAAELAFEVARTILLGRHMGVDAMG
jgi:hypothetical protein